MSIGNSVLRIIIVLLLLGVFPSLTAVASADGDPGALLSHDLDVELVPATHELIGRDLTDLDVPTEATAVTFTIAPTLRVDSIVLDGRTEGHRGSDLGVALAFTTDRTTNPPSQQIVVTLPHPHERHMTLAWTYRGTIDDPPKEPRHLRFVTPSETAGHIGPEGVYLSAESQWYPDIEGSFSTYRLRVLVPDDWTVVTQGRKQDGTAGGGRASSTWVVSERSEALTLVANKFVVTARKWTSRGGQLIEIATYFFPEHAGLADEYLDATAKYLDAYIPILGEFPFSKFAVVENFFASGLGMPSFTLLGSGSIQRHYVQPYALGHEIVHSWIGNSVFNRAGHGNWVEGLTTYLANYYWHELTHDDRQAIEQRRMMLQGYSVYVEPDQDYPVARFFAKHDEKDNAIGYQKSAFVFHQLRREIGDEAFWRGLKTFVGRYRNQPADWGSLETVFTQESRRDLRWFFEQWVEQGGAPLLSLGAAEAAPEKGDDGAEVWRVRVRVQQAGRPFRMVVPVLIVTAQGAETKWMNIGPPSTDVAEFLVRDRPVRVQLDPDVTVFRRIVRAQLTPMLNGYVTDRSRTVVRAFSDPASPLEQVVDRISEQEAQWPDSKKTRVSRGGEAALPPSGSVLVLGGAEQTGIVRSIAEQFCGDRIRLGDTGFSVNGQQYDGPEMAVLFTCPRVQVPGSVVTVLYGMSSGAVEKLSRFLFYYGWQSYVVFKNGAAVQRGIWRDEPEMKEVRIDATR